MQKVLVHNTALKGLFCLTKVAADTPPVACGNHLTKVLVHYSADKGFLCFVMANVVFLLMTANGVPEAWCGCA